MNLAIITGTTRGLGLSLSKRFEEVGWRVTGLNRPTFDLSALDLDQLDNIFADLVSVANFERVVFVNNAATHHIAAASSLHAAEVQRELTTNIVSPILTISAFLRHFPAGEVANVTSAAATQPFPFWSLYSSAKAALEGYVRSIEAEGVKVHTLNPGAVDTDMQREIRSADFPGVEKFIAMKADGKLKSPDMIAKSLVWMVDRAVEPAS